MRSFRKFFTINSPSMNVCSRMSGVKGRTFTRFKYFVQEQNTEQFLGNLIFVQIRLLKC